MNAEKKRLLENLHNKKKWKMWGPYVTDRQWGTVREDYSKTGNAWEYIPFDHSRSKAYRWGEEGIGGICDDKQLLCLGLALWNGKDPIIKENYFGLNGLEGNHGEDVKDYYYYLDSTPTHSYMKMLYKYPQSEFPYNKLKKKSRSRSKKDPEYELINTGIFDADKYFDVFIEYAKKDDEDILIKIRAYNRGDEDSELFIIPQIWFRNTWAWGYDDYVPKMDLNNDYSINIDHRELNKFTLYYDGKPEVLFCENATNSIRLYNKKNVDGYFKDGINDYLVNNIDSAINPAKSGTKGALVFKKRIGAKKSVSIKLRLANYSVDNPFLDFAEIFKQRIKEANEFYKDINKTIRSKDEKNIHRQALAGMLWSKQFYYFDIPQWLNGDPGQPPPPRERLKIRNEEWVHLNNADIISMPDKWEYPWYAAWDLAFHCIPLAMVDPQFAKEQLKLFTREWYMHPNGQLPAYEWNFSNVNPPVHAWATWRVYKMDKNLNKGKGDIQFLESVFHKMLLNFTWWVNRKDKHGHNIFQGGFLGLDNIGVFDRSSELPTGGHIEQADGTAWMAMFSLNLLRISLELALHNNTYEDLATKFLEHFLYIAGAMTNIGGDGIDLWDDEDKFYYDVLNTDEGEKKLKIRSMIGLIPLFAVEVIEPETLECLPNFGRRLKWFLQYRPDLANLVSRWYIDGKGERRLFSLLRGHRLKKILKRMLDENEFLSEFGVRALSKYHETHPYVFKTNDREFKVSYQPGESDSYMFGGNSNWRGPIWFPVNFLIIESLERFHHYYGDDFKVEYPTNSGKYFTLNEISIELSKRLTKIFLRDEKGNRAVYGENKKFQTDRYFKEYILFYEYFNGDNGSGIGASHQTGWTGLIAKLLQPKPV